MHHSSNMRLGECLHPKHKLHVCVLLPARKLDPKPESLPAGLVPFVWHTRAVAKWLWMMRLETPLLGTGGSAAVTPHLFMHVPCFMQSTSVKSIKKCYMIETQLMWLKRWKTFTVSEEGKGKIWLLVQKWEWWLRSAGTKYKQVNVVITLSLTITTKHHKTVFVFSLFPASRLMEKV